MSKYSIWYFVFVISSSMIASASEQKADFPSCGEALVPDASHFSIYEFERNDKGMREIQIGEYVRIVPGCNNSEPIFKDVEGGRYVATPNFIWGDGTASADYGIYETCRNEMGYVVSEDHGVFSTFKQRREVTREWLNYWIINESLLVTVSQKENLKDLLVIRDRNERVMVMAKRVHSKGGASKWEIKSRKLCVKCQPWNPCTKSFNCDGYMHQLPPSMIAFILAHKVNSDFVCPTGIFGTDWEVSKWVVAGAMAAFTVALTASVLFTWCSYDTCKYGPDGHKKRT